MDETGEAVFKVALGSEDAIVEVVVAKDRVEEDVVVVITVFVDEKVEGIVEVVIGSAVQHPQQTVIVEIVFMDEVVEPVVKVMVFLEVVIAVLVVA